MVKWTKKEGCGVRRTLAACCTGHFLVDFACAFLLFRALWGEADWNGLLLTYNFCAFAVQMPLGLLADRWERDGLTAAAGTAAVALAYGLADAPWLAVVLAGLGNAAFHVGGGLEVLSLSGDRGGPLGLFVSPGAVGLFLGSLLGKGRSFPLWLVPVLLLFAAGALLWARQERPKRAAGHLEPCPALPLLLLLAVVVLRSYVGMTLTFPWRGTGQWALLLTLGMALGKAAGGYLADRFGPRRTAVGSLTVSSALLLASSIPACGAAAVLCFNMTMPLTLWAAARRLPDARGFAFGLLTFGLFLGFLPAAFGAQALSGTAAAIWAAVSLLLLLPWLGRAVDK